MANKKYYNMHTRQEEFLYKFIEKIGCMSFWQARYVLTEYYGCNQKQAEKVIMSLGKKRYFKFIDEQRFLRANSLLDNSKLDMNMIIALSAALEKCHITQEVESITSDSGQDHQLSFIADNSLYYVLKLPSKSKDFMPKMFLAKNNFLQNAKIIAKNGNKQVFGYTTLFVFSSDADIDDTLDTIAELELEMPHEIYFAKPGELYDRIEFERFAEDDSDEDGDYDFDDDYDEDDADDEDLD